MLWILPILVFITAAKASESLLDRKPHPFIVELEAVHERIGEIKLGKVGGLAFDKNHRKLFIFHRPGFDPKINAKTPIKHDVILEVEFHGNLTRVVRKLGAGKFYRPHGIYYEDGHLYTTDAASHTVAKWDITGKEMKLVWETGVKLEPGSDGKHYCKPTAITKVGSRIFVTDGYCNSRVVELDVNGTRVNSFGILGKSGGHFHIPHDVIVDPNGHLLISDRENGRVQEISIDGVFKNQIRSPLFSTIYSADVFNHHIFMIPGRPRPGHGNEPISLFVTNNDHVEVVYGPLTKNANYQMIHPHVLRVCPYSNHIFVGDILPDGTATLLQFRVKG